MSHSLLAGRELSSLLRHSEESPSDGPQLSEDPRNGIDHPSLLTGLIPQGEIEPEKVSAKKETLSRLHFVTNGQAEYRLGGRVWFLSGKATTVQLRGIEP